MLQNRKAKLKTVSEKVAELILHPNDSESECESGEEQPRVIEFEEEYEAPQKQSTDIRKRNVKLLSEQSARYRGKISSRKDFEGVEESESNDDDDDAEVGDTDEDEALQKFSRKLKSSDEKTDSNEEEYSDEDESGSDLEKESESGEEDENDENVTAGDIMTETNRSAEIQKGVCVQNQLQLWERLLEVRIHSQKILGKANQLPELQLAPHTELQQASLETAAHTSALLKTLLELQQALCKQNSELKTAMKKSLKRPAAAAFDDTQPQPALKRISEQLDTHFSEFKPYRNVVLLKWDDRTRLLTPGAGAKKKSLNEEFDILRKVENTLLNRNALIEKSQTLKSNAVAAAPSDGASQDVATHEHEKRDGNIYDDSDFYHQQLRELIEYKANTSANMVEVTKQYVELQKLRQKMKKKVDTRASKGRKLRYVVHNKLINFMAPDESSNWTEDSKNELCKSLFAS